MADATKALTVGLTIAIVLLLGGAMVEDFSGTGDGLRENANQTVLLDDTGTYTQIESVAGYNEVVRNSRGLAVNLTGSDDSYVQTTNSLDIASSENFSVSVWAQVDNGSESKTMTAASLNGRVVIAYNGSQGNWTAWYYDEGDRTSYRANVSAPDQPQNLTNIQVVFNTTDMRIWRNNTSGEVQDITIDQHAAQPNGTNWDGRLDELRTFNSTLNASDRGDVYNKPIFAQPGTDRTARVMFDEPNKDTQSVFFAPGVRMDVNNGTFSQGLPGQKAEVKNVQNDLAGESDYVWDTDGPRIKPLFGGELDGAPVAYITYERETALSEMQDSWISYVAVASLLPLVLVLGVILNRVRGI